MHPDMLLAIARDRQGDQRRLAGVLAAHAPLAYRLRQRWKRRRDKTDFDLAA